MAQERLIELRLVIDKKHADHLAIKALLLWLIENGFLREVRIE